MSSTSRDVVSRDGGTSGPSSSKQMSTHLRKGIQLLSSMTQEVMPHVAQPEKFEQVSFEIVERFKNMGSGSAGQRIGRRDLLHCTELLRQFQELTKAPSEDEEEEEEEEEEEAAQSQKPGRTRDLVARNKTIELMRRGVNEGMVFVAQSATQATGDTTDALDLKGVEAFGELLGGAKKLIEQSISSMLEDSLTEGEDPGAHLHSRDEAEYYRGGLAYRDISKEGVDEIERRQDGHYAGQS